MAERCYNDDPVSFGSTGGKHPRTGLPRRTQGIEAPGAVPKGWCQLNPWYLALPADVNPKIKAKADEALARLESQDSWESHVIDGTEYVFVLRGLYMPDSPEGDYSYPGIWVYRREPGGAPWPYPNTKRRGRPRDGAFIVSWEDGSYTPELNDEVIRKHGGGIKFKEDRARWGKYAIRPWHQTIGGFAIALTVAAASGMFYLKSRLSR